MRDYQESDYRIDTQTNAGQSDPYVPLCLASDTKMQFSLLLQNMLTQCQLC